MERLVALLGTSAAEFWNPGRCSHGQGIDRRAPKLASALAVLGAGPHTRCRSASLLSYPALLSSRSTTPSSSATTPVHLHAEQCAMPCPAVQRCTAPGPVLILTLCTYAPTHGPLCYALPSRAETVPACPQRSLTYHLCLLMNMQLVGACSHL